MRRWWPVLVLALALGALSPLASRLPDGLESVAEHAGFAAKAAAPPVQAPLPDYALPGREESPAAGGLVGVIGTAMVFALAYGLGRALARRRGRPPDD